MRRRAQWLLIYISAACSLSFAYTQNTDPLESFIRIDGFALSDSVNPYDTARYRELNSEMGMYEPIITMQLYMGINLERGHIVVLESRIINIVLRPLASVAPNQIKKKLRAALPRVGVFFSDNGKRCMWASLKYTIEYTYGENTKWIYIYETPPNKQ